MVSSEWCTGWYTRWYTRWYTPGVEGGGMQINEPPAQPSAISAARDGGLPGRVRRSRPRIGQTERVSLQLTPAERAQLEEAAALAGMSTSRFCAEASLAAATGIGHGLHEAQQREGMARLQRQLFGARTEVNLFATDVKRAVTRLNSSGDVPPELVAAVALTAASVARLDELIAAVDRRLR
jgi:uncharacterized protein (DUF1778 family)